MIKNNDYYCDSCGLEILSPYYRRGHEHFCAYCAPFHKIVVKNLTPHAIHLHVDGEIITLQPESIPARVEEVIETIGSINEIPIVQKQFGEITGLPRKEKDTFFIVSLLVAQASRRKDLLVVGEPIRDADGKIVGAKSLARI